MKRIWHRVAAVILFIILITAAIPYLWFNHISRQGIYQDTKKKIQNSITQMADYLVASGDSLEVLEKIYDDPSLQVRILESLKTLELDESQEQRLKKEGSLFILKRDAASREYCVVVIDYHGQYLMWKFNISSTFGPIHQAAVMSLITSLVLGSIIAVFASFRLSKPIQELDAATQKVAAGDFTICLPERGKDEVASLVRSFNIMIKELRSVELLRSDFVSDISHEFKTPLTAIEGYAKLLEQESDPQERAEYIQIINQEAHRLSTLAENILFLNRIEKGNISAKKTLVRVDEQIRWALTLYEQKWSQKEIALELELEEVSFLGYEAMLSQVWTNLIDNAIKFSPEKGRIFLCLSRQQEGFRFTIRDEGCGIPPEKQSHIFDKFYQADQSRGGEGNGLGLAIVKKLVELHHGKIQVESSSEGSAFTVIM